MPCWLYTVIAFFAGAVCGIFVVALMQAARSDDDT